MPIAEITMSPGDFRHWVGKMKERKLAETEHQMAQMLGVNPNSITRFKKEGTDTRTALACSALLRGAEPYRQKVRRH